MTGVDARRREGVVQLRRRRRTSVVGGLLAAASLLFLPVHSSSAQSGRAVLHGMARVAGQPLVGFHVVLFAAQRTAATALADGTTDSTGAFELTYEPPATGVLYVEATASPSSQLVLRSVVGIAGTASSQARPAASSVTVDELTTVATTFALAQFSGGRGISGPSPGLQNAAATVFNLVNPVDGNAGAVVTNQDNGANNDTLATLGTLANLVSLCAPHGGGGCEDFLRSSTPPGGAAPKDTVQAILNLALHPTLAPDRLFDLAQSADAVQPALTAAPAAWTLVLLYTEPDLYASGRIAIDAEGNVWSSNNWLPGTKNPSPYVTVLDPVGQPTLGSPIEGGGMKGGAWGAAITPSGDAWLGSFGGDAMSQYAADGTPMSPDDGWTDGALSHPQGVAVDQRGNIWIANNYGPESAPGQGSVVVYPGGDPGKAITITGGGLNHPFAVQIDGFGRAWVTNAGPGGANLVNTRADVLIGKFGGSVTVIGPDFKPTSFSPIEDDAFKWPLGVSIDSKDNAWVANYFGSSVTQLDPDGTVAANIALPKGTLPWSEAVDGSDRVWVAGFGRPAVWLLCGATTDACPPGASTGAILSPRDGFPSKAFQHFTSIQIDQSGNVWLSNNWSNLVPPVGGVGIAEIVGAATPVCTPLTPRPVQPSATGESACPQRFAPAVAPPSSDDSSSGMPVWTWVLVGTGAILLAAVALVVVRRRRHASSRPADTA
jgi:hypothetical protein